MDFTASRGSLFKALGDGHGRYLVLEGGREAVVEHLLMEDRGDAARHRRDDPHPVGRAAPAAPVLVLHVLDEGLGGRVVIHDGHLVTLSEGEGSQELQVNISRRRKPNWWGGLGPGSRAWDENAHQVLHTMDINATSDHWPRVQS